MKKYFVMLLMIMCLMGCVSTKDVQTMEESTKVKTLCIDGVTYIYIKEIVTPHLGFGYMSVKLDTHSKIVPCVEETKTEQNI